MIREDGGPLVDGLPNSFSESSPESKPSRSSASNSLSVPSNSGFVRCPTAESAASTTSSMDSYAPLPITACIRCSCSGVRWSVIVVVLAEALYARFKTCFVVPLDPSIFFCSIMIA